MGTNDFALEVVIAEHYLGVIVAGPSACWAGGLALALARRAACPIECGDFRCDATETVIECPGDCS